MAVPACMNGVRAVRSGKPVIDKREQRSAGRHTKSASMCDTFIASAVTCKKAGRIIRGSSVFVALLCFVPLVLPGVVLRGPSQER